MSLLTAALLGLVQGITEFLPISSAGHLALIQTIFGIDEADALFDVMLHLGSALSAGIVFRRELSGAARGALGLVGIGPDKGRTTRRNLGRRRLGLFLLAGTLPLALAVALWRPVTGLYQNTALVSLMLLLSGGVLYLADRAARGVRGLLDGSALQALAVGAGQLCAVVPGISRTGMTISVGTLCGFSQSFAAQFSVLLYVPAVLGAAVVTLIQTAGSGIHAAMIPAYLMGMLASAVAGYFGLRLLRYISARGRLGRFAYYCWGAGLIALVLSLIA